MSHLKAWLIQDYNTHYGTVYNIDVRTYLTENKEYLYTRYILILLFLCAFRLHADPLSCPGRLWDLI